MFNNFQEYYDFLDKDKSYIRQIHLSSNLKALMTELNSEDEMKNCPFEIYFNDFHFSKVNITHRIDFLVDKSRLNGFSVAIDYLNKILIGFLIYQFVSAFRKCGKK